MFTPGWRRKEGRTARSSYGCVLGGTAAFSGPAGTKNAPETHYGPKNVLDAVQAVTGHEDESRDHLWQTTN
jgi:hypothetical protein